MIQAASPPRKARRDVRAAVVAAIWLAVATEASRAEDLPPQKSPPVSVDVRFSHEQIPPLELVAAGHRSVTKNGVKFDVYFDRGRKTNVAIYAINTGRKQLVLTPKHHQAILTDLLRRQFTVIVADFRDRSLAGIELEKYVVQLTADAKEAADGVLPGSRSRAANAASATDTFADDYFTLMPGFTVQREVTWFKYGDLPAAFRREIARQLGKETTAADAEKANTFDIIYPVYGPEVGVLTNYASDEKAREPYYPLENRFLAPAFALKNMAIVHQQYFNDPVGGYHKGYDYYGDQLATAFIRHLKGNAARYHLDSQKICCFGHSKGSETPGMLVNKLRDAPPFRQSKVDFKKTNLTPQEKTAPSPFADLPTEIACAIFGAGVANNELRSDRMLPWNDAPAKHISPFFVYADHGELMRERTRELVTKAKSHGLEVESAELAAHTWPIGEAYDRASAFADRILRPTY